MSSIAAWLLLLLNALARFAWQQGQRVHGLVAGVLARLAEWLAR